ncbi:MAG TPA: DedA family protein [bacterium]|nr:DedA family protein [bacterium]HNB09317.1 DedA family protein [bacterium]HNB55422.1 DedA family protein [bacterium]HNC47959.1 DedA family protein [bacterium]HND76489.1 DedA family protein [bacterium]
MELIAQFIDFFIHLDVHLGELIQNYGTWTYLILFLIIFAETGLVVTPILPGDSLLFAAGAFAGLGYLDPWWLFILLTVAGIIGDSVNYAVGLRIGPKIFHKENVRFLNKEYLQQAHMFYEKHGGKTIIFARFIPIIRTFAPFVAGIGQMTYRHFIFYNIIGSIAWVGLFVSSGYFFGNIPTVRKNFTLVIVAIIIISVIPAVIEFIRARRKSGINEA